MKSRHLALDIGITVLVTGGLVVGSLALSHLTHGTIKQFGSTLLTVLLMLIGSLLLLSLLERVAPPAGPRKSINRLLNFRINILYLFAGSLLGITTMTAALGTMTAALGTALGTMTAALGRHFGLGLIDLRFAAGRGVVGSIGAILLSVFIFDFFFYWYHRCMHKMPFLWQVHKLHHMDQQLDVLSNNRENWIDQFVGAFLISMPMTIFFKLDSSGLAVVGIASGVIIFVYAVFFHANIRLSYGRASVLLVGPQVHRIHHSRLPEHVDKNFAAFFPIWDVLFGTYYHPARDEFPPTGVDSEKEVESLAEATLLPFREWRRMFREWRRRDSVPA